MKALRFLTLLVIMNVLILGCVPSSVRFGQRLFAGCSSGVDNRATLETGQFVCKGRPDRRPFAGNGRACGSCHMPGDNFGLSLTRIASLPTDHPLFFAGLDENPQLLKTHGLINVTAPGAPQEFRRTPKLVHLQALCDRYGECVSLGLLGDGPTDLCTFSKLAIAQHLAKSVARIPGQDFRLPTDSECNALVEYMLSDLVAGQSERSYSGR